MRRLSKILVTAGPTREKLDSIRFISNFSTGKMGYELARAARRRGYKVTLISGPTHLIPPQGINFIKVEDAAQMYKAVKRNLKSADCLFMASAVSDWRPQSRAKGKLKKGSKRAISLKLVRNPDILGSVGRVKGGKILAGFALESDALTKNARLKLKEKNLDLIAANKVGKRSPFGEEAIAKKLLNKVEKLWEDGR